MSQKSWTTKVTLLLVSSLTIMSIITISPALPMITDAFSHVPNGKILVKLVLTIPALMIAIIAPFAGKSLDRSGRLKYLWVALIVYALAGSAGFYLQNIYALLFSRVLLGAAVGVTMTIVITLVPDYFEGKERQSFVGLQIAFMSLAGILFIGLGGLLSDISWRYPFLIYLLSLIILPLTLFFLSEPNIDTSTNKLQTSIKSPPFIWVLFLNTMCIWILFFLVPVQIPFLLLDLNIESGSMAGAAIALSTLASAISSFSFSKIKNKLSATYLFTLGYLLMASGFITVFFAYNYSMILLSLALAGFGMGLLIPNTNVWVMKIAPQEIRGKEMGKLTTFWFMGQFLSPIVLAPIMFLVSIQTAFLIAGGVMVLLGIAFVFVKND